MILFIEAHSDQKQCHRPDHRPAHSQPGASTHLIQQIELLHVFLHRPEARGIFLQFYVIKRLELLLLPRAPQLLFPTRPPALARVAISSPIEIAIKLEVNSTKPTAEIASCHSVSPPWIPHRLIPVSLFVQMHLALTSESLVGQSVSTVHSLSLFLLFNPLEQRPESLIHPFLHNFSIPY